MWNILLTTQVFASLAVSSPSPSSSSLEDIETTSPTLTDLPPAPAPLIKLTDFGLSRFVDIRSEEERERDREARRAERRGRDVGGASGGMRKRRKGDESETEETDETEEEEEEEEEEEGPLLSTRCGSEAYAAPELVMGAPVSARERTTTRVQTRTRREGERGHETTPTATLQPVQGQAREGQDSPQEIQEQEREPHRPQPRTRAGVYDARETDAWACGVVLYALVARRLPFGEGVSVGARGRGGGGGGVTREGAGGGEKRVEGKEGRRAWLMRIARGEYEWPLGPASCAITETGAPATQTGTEEKEEEEGKGKELIGPALAHSTGARRIVGRLLVRDPRKRARIAELWGDTWMGGEGVPSAASVGWEAEAEEVEAEEAEAEEAEEEEAEREQAEEEEEDLELALARAEEEVDEFGWIVDQDGIDDIARREVV
ncbi:hypothetical protein DXG03_000657 [Asterophora parasitica]|uniref:non-specific serine/threonine protein kinase n=1 Tax=Asterophora parasitica TaxID=117018 RepID=A0A9P7G7H8_9AGAR|nr:hypothetical protein DXG03_000657 [Asterophora parasitica]